MEPSAKGEEPVHVRARFPSPPYEDPDNRDRLLWRIAGAVDSIRDRIEQKADADRVERIERRVFQVVIALVGIAGAAALGLPALLGGG